MKKQIGLILVALMATLNACADSERLVAFEQMPAPAQAKVTEFFQRTDVSYVTEEREIFGSEYKVRLNNGWELEFDSNGDMIKADAQKAALPAGLVPEGIQKYVSTTFPSAVITEWKKDGRTIDVELNNGLDLVFDLSYNFLRIDD